MKISTEIAVNVWPEQNQQGGQEAFVPAPGLRIGNKNILNRRLRNVSFKIKEISTTNKIS